jgi:hypothetical protein
MIPEKIPLIPIYPAFSVLSRKVFFSSAALEHLNMSGRCNRIPSTQKVILQLRLSSKITPGSSGCRLPEKRKPAAGTAYVSR